MRSPNEADRSKPAASGQAHGLVLRNATWLIVAQVLGTPIAIAVNAVMGRRLGPADFGFVYVATTVCGLALLLVEWGQPTALPGLIAIGRSRAGALLGSALVWRAGLATLVFGGVAAGMHLLGAAADLQVAVALVAVAFTMGSLGRACHEAVRGLERTDLAAFAIVGQPLLVAAIVIPTLLLGGGLVGALTAQVVAAALGLAILAVVIRPMGIGRLSFRAEVLRDLVRDGSPFLALGIATAMQPTLDALLLSKLAPPEVVGWHAASMKLVGALVLPASSLITALYPTLFRLHAENREAYRETAAGALRTATVLVVPLALGCAIYPRLGVSIFGEGSFGPALDNLRVLAPYVFLVYFSMTLGCCLAAAGRRRAWVLLQYGCVVAAAALDLLLIPWFQARTGNGGLGVAASLLLCEIVIVAVAVWLAPAGLMGRRFVVTALRAAVAGLAMTLVARLLGGVTPWVAAPVSVSAYGSVLLLLGGPEVIHEIRGLIGARRSRPDHSN